MYVFDKILQTQQNTSHLIYDCYKKRDPSTSISVQNPAHPLYKSWTGCEDRFSGRMSGSWLFSFNLHTLISLINCLSINVIRSLTFLLKEMRITPLLFTHKKPVLVAHT